MPDGPLTERVRERLRNLRKRRGLTQGDVVDRAGADSGLSQSDVSKHETGDLGISLDQVDAYSRVFEVPLTDLLGPTPLPELPEAVAAARRLADRIVRLAPEDQRLVELWIDRFEALPRGAGTARATEDPDPPGAMPRTIRAPRRR